VVFLKFIERHIAVMTFENQWLTCLKLHEFVLTTLRTMKETVLFVQN